MSFFLVVVTSTGAATESTVTEPNLLAKLADVAIATNCFANGVDMEEPMAAAMTASFAARVVFTLYETCRVCARRLPCKRRPTTANVVVVVMPAVTVTVTSHAATLLPSKAAMVCLKTVL